MIPISIQPEPEDFEQKVREPGYAFLEKHPHPTKKQWEKNAYWQRALDEVYDLYGGICAYCCEWIAPTTGDPTVDHFRPKSIHYHEAYEWSNFRLACLRFNRWKREYQDIIDPFTVGIDWFQLQFPSLQVLPNPELPLDEKNRVIETIKRLRLNHNLCIRSRKRWIMSFSSGNINFIFLCKNAPFIARELERQGYRDRISEIVKL